MARWQLGDKDKARAWFDKSLAWMDKSKKDDVELKRLCAEAAELLRVKDVSPSRTPRPAADKGP